jgi:hypothetical protein
VKKLMPSAASEQSEGHLGRQPRIIRLGEDVSTDSRNVRIVHTEVRRV